MVCLRFPLLFLLMAAAPAFGEAPWIDEITAGPFTIHSEFSLRDAQPLVSQLGELNTDLHETLGLDFSDRPIHIHLFSTRWTYQRYLAARIPAAAVRQALYLPGKEAGYVYAWQQRELTTDVRHEATHALLRNALPDVPLWLDEGLAEYFEISPAARADNQPHRKSLQRSLRFGGRPDLASLEAKQTLADFEGKDYRDAWAWVQFLLHGPPEAREELTTFFSDLASGDAPIPLSQRLKQRFPDLEQRFIQYHR